LTLIPDPQLAFGTNKMQACFGSASAAWHYARGDALNLRESFRRCVVRLKGGDPFIFGRGGEEMEALVEAGIAVEVVPGVTAAAGIAAYAGIPLTHREHSRSVIFTTGFLKDGALDLDWPMLARPGQTLVIYMGISRLGEICRELIAHGLPGTTPAGVVERGTTPAQRVVVANLASLPERVAAADIRPPALTLVGDVVALYPRLEWFVPADHAATDHAPHAGCTAVNRPGPESIR
jgi:uroporphyrin-III C-methyltransferase/precorrin-2 dehydrogenase/sirohydrochlorin ferrochelatase/uroporphyrin-III C-methyltransferase